MTSERNSLQAKIIAGEANHEDKLRYRELRDDIKSKTYRTPEKNYDLDIKLPKDTTHMVLSVGGRAKNTRQLKKATEAVREFLNRHLDNVGHRYAFVPHNDTQNLHFHVIVKNCNELDKSMLRFDKADLFLMRQSFAKELDERDFQRVATLRKDRHLSLEKIAKGVEQVRENQTWYQRQLSKGKNASFDAFSYRSKVIKKTNFLIGALKSEQSRTNFFQIEKNKNINGMIKELKQFNKQVSTIKPKDLETAKTALKNHLQQESQFVAKKIDRIKGFTYDDMQTFIENKRERNLESANLFLKSHQQNLQQASKHLGSSYQAIFTQLHQTASLGAKILKGIRFKKMKDMGFGWD